MKRLVSEQFQGRTRPVYPWTEGAPGRVLIRIEPAAAVLHPSHPADCPSIRRSRWDPETGLPASVSASDHHFSKPARESSAQKLQLLSGHAEENSLAIYRDLALADVSEEYEQAMRTFPVR